MNTRRARWLAALVVGITLMVTNPAVSFATGGTTPRPSFTFQGRRCLEASALVPAQASRLHDIVSAPFKVKETAPGLALIAMGFAHCEELSVNGGEARTSAIFSDVGVFIEPPDGSEDTVPGSHIYQLWQPSNVRDLVRKMKKVGILTSLVRDASFGNISEPLGGSAIGVRGTMPWSYSPYRLTVSAPPPGPGTGAGANTWWHEGDDDDSVVKISRWATELASNPGTFKLAMTPGSPLADYVGSPLIAGVASALYFGTENGAVSEVDL